MYGWILLIYKKDDYEVDNRDKIMLNCSQQLSLSRTVIIFCVPRNLSAVSLLICWILQAHVMIG